jgi:hypothetical protein
MNGKATNLCNMLDREFREKSNLGHSYGREDDTEIGLIRILPEDGNCIEIAVKPRVSGQSCRTQHSFEFCTCVA